MTESLVRAALFITVFAIVFTVALAIMTGITIAVSSVIRRYR